jgi:hypothetical protein
METESRASDSLPEYGMTLEFSPETARADAGLTDNRIRPRELADGALGLCPPFRGYMPIRCCKLKAAT